MGKIRSEIEKLFVYLKNTFKMFKTCVRQIHNIYLNSLSIYRVNWCLRLRY